jgi:hypothetical protein
MNLRLNRSEWKGRGQSPVVFPTYQDSRQSTVNSRRLAAALQSQSAVSTRQKAEGSKQKAVGEKQMPLILTRDT